MGKNINNRCSSCYSRTELIVVINLTEKIYKKEGTQKRRHYIRGDLSVNCGISALFPSKAQFLLHCRGEGGRGGDMGVRECPCHFQNWQACSAIFRRLRCVWLFFGAGEAIPRNKAAPHPGRNRATWARNRFGMTLMADIPSPPFFEINQQKFYKSEPGARYIPQLWEWRSEAFLDSHDLYMARSAILF